MVVMKKTIISFNALTEYNVAMEFIKQNPDWKIGESTGVSITVEKIEFNVVSLEQGENNEANN